MSEVDFIYQTVKDKGNPRELEQDGPIYCESDEAWLGNGYYFWHGHIELGHWWGQSRLKVAYMIFMGHCNIRPKCLDLHDNPTHRDYFIDAMIEMKKLNELTKKYHPEFNEEVLVSKVVQFIRKRHLFNFEAIKAYGIGSMNPSHPNAIRINVESKKGKYVDLIPAVQICLFEKNSLGLHNYKIVYPSTYIEPQVF